jgi:hypothetical protein
MMYMVYMMYICIQRGEIKHIQRVQRVQWVQGENKPSPMNCAMCMYVLCVCMSICMYEYVSV